MDIKVLEEDSYMYVNPPKPLKDIVFLWRKLEMLESKINEEHSKFVRKMAERFKKDMERQFTKVDFKKTSSQELVFEHVFTSASADNELFFHLDTFLIDLKRAIEFMLRFIISSNKLPSGNFGLQKVLVQIKDDYEGNKLDFVDFLIKKHKKYIKYLNSKEAWLSSLNNRRLNAIHYEISNKVGGFRIRAEYNSLQTPLKDEPIITLPELPFGGETIPIFIKNNLKDLKEFLNESLKICKGSLKKVKFISESKE